MTYKIKQEITSQNVVSPLNNKPKTYVTEIKKVNKISCYLYMYFFVFERTLAQVDDEWTEQEIMAFTYR